MGVPIGQSDLIPSSKCIYTWWTVWTQNSFVAIMRLGDRSHQGDCFCRMTVCLIFVKIVRVNSSLDNLTFHHSSRPSTLSLPRAINFKFPLHCSLTRNILRWKMIMLPILTTSFIHFSLEGWENVLFELGSDRVNPPPQARETRARLAGVG